jgi:hypothetical protein
VIVLAVLLAAAPLQDTTAQVTRPIPPDSYADSATAELVRAARAARQRNEALVTAYTATVHERIGVGMHALMRDRMVYHEELAAHISWRRDSISTVTVLGAREGVPIAKQGVQLPDDLRGEMYDLVIDPAQNELRVIGANPRDSGIIYPLRPGGEQDYRFAIGDTTTIVLPDGKRVRIVALQVTPRRADYRLMVGTLWFDAGSHELVRILFRPARAFDLRRDADSGDMKDVPGFVNVKADARYVTLEYGLYEQRWWLPRLVAIDAYGTMGSWLNVPVRIERTYDDYRVEGGTPRDPNSAFRPAGSPRRRFRRDTTMSDSARRAAAESNLTVVIPSDTAALLASPDLGPPVLQMGDMISEDEVKHLGDALQQMPSRPWEHRLELPSGVGALLAHARYNRIEALSLQARGQLDLGRLDFLGSARFGIADRVLNGEVSLQRQTPNTRLTLTGYRRLAAANADNAPFGGVNSTEALLFQIDDGEYYRTLGAEATFGNPLSQRWGVRLYYQRETPAFVETQAALPHLFNHDRHFRPNILADSATEAGAAVTLRGQHVVSATLRFGTELNLSGATGDFDYGKGSATVRAFVTPPGGWSTAVSLSAGTSTGTLPVQALHELGGVATLRGYAGGVTAGTAFWFSRLEVARGIPAARLVLFGDAGWAGDRASFGSGGTLADIGVGGSFLDGLLRIDLARGLRAPIGWRLNFAFNGLL